MTQGSQYPKNGAMTQIVMPLDMHIPSSYKSYYSGTLISMHFKTNWLILCIKIFFN